MSTITVTQAEADELAPSAPQPPPAPGYMSGFKTMYMAQKNKLRSSISNRCLARVNHTVLDRLIKEAKNQGGSLSLAALKALQREINSSFSPMCGTEYRQMLIELERFADTHGDSITAEQLQTELDNRKLYTTTAEVAAAKPHALFMYER